MFSEQQYRDFYKRSIEDPEGYWSEIAEKISWFKKWDSVCDFTDPINPKWFHGAKLNVCYNCLDRHVAEGKADKVVFHHRSALTNKDRNITYGYLLKEVSKLAAVLAHCGVQTGDTVAIYMPNIPEGIIAMLACSRLGAIHCVLFGGLSTTDLALRMEHCNVKVVISAVTGMFRNELLNYKEKIDSALMLTKIKPEKCIFFSGDNKSVKVTAGRDLIWEEVIDQFGTHDCVPVESSHPMFYIYTSGTTGNPKTVVIESGPTVVRYISEVEIIGMKNLVCLASSELGWILGHALFCYLPLLNDFPSVVYEGDLTAECGTVYKLVQDFKINHYVGSYSTIRGVQAKDPDGIVATKFDLSSMKRLSIGAESPDTKSMEFSKKIFSKAVVSNMWGQTEANMSLATFFSSEQYEENCILLHPKPSPGIKLVAFKEDKTEAAVGEIGKLTVKLPLPPGFAATLLHRRDFFLQEYFTEFPGYYDTKDEGFYREDGSIQIIGRSDDVINVGPYRVAGPNVEEVILQHSDVFECLVVGIPDAMKGEVPLAFFTRREDSRKPIDSLTKEVNDLVLEKLGSSIFFKGSVCVKKFPRTMTGKIQRKIVRQMLHGKELTLSSEDRLIVDDILHAVQLSGMI